MNEKAQYNFLHLEIIFSFGMPKKDQRFLSSHSAGLIYKEKWRQHITSLQLT